ncbi:MAG: Spx/MgsR family RNA polymerase-binding regulatory protein [Pyrinomonadaceae bacterium]|nr:Spx/MgsR family RNA polymerase-binding regulatory protein [Pyrinomonadaceae bacterium]
MAKVNLYGLPHCSTCQKAVAYLEEKGVGIEKFHDIKENRLSRKEVKKLVNLVGGVDKLFSKRAMKYRSMGLNNMDLSEKDLLDYMIEEYTFIRRPVLVFGEKALAGFSKKKYDELLGS